MNTQRWIPPLFVQASVGIHGIALASLLVAPGQWPLAVGALILNHLGIMAAGLWPRSRLLGPNLLRLPDAAAARGEICITIDDGPDPEITPQVLDILARYGARASFFCIGKRVRRHAKLARRIVEAGHGIENHSERHLHSFSLSGPGKQQREVAEAQASIGATSGRRPVFFRAPAGLRNPFLDFVLHREGLRLASWTRRGFDTREGNAALVLARLTRNLAAGDILLLHDSHAARTERGIPVILEVLPQLLELCAAKGLRCVALHEVPELQGSR